MKGDKKVIQTLNLSLKGELTAINQYFLHARIFESWGVTKLAKHEKAESIEEMGHADLLIQRILLLGGLPNLQDLDKLMIGETVKEALECDMKLEKAGIASYRKGIVVCEETQDYVTRDLLIKILADEEGHLDHIETQLKMIEGMGLENYLQLQSASADQ
ncbi:MAG: bacterioferritin [Micavibrio aeruginosavorus]|uniref:Bacterioferritin n=1 Tax=Micavibrio aeruginosavorus TaxID=349221 RepID=A0A7T5R3W8_9BACT|nr:MAG: bacterioferritin [Micavibrio aeruginosavorus]